MASLDVLHFDMDLTDIREAVDAAKAEIARVGDVVADDLHMMVFGYGRDVAPGALYAAASVSRQTVRIVPTYGLLKFISLMRRSGRA